MICPLHNRPSLLNQSLRAVQRKTTGAVELAWTIYDLRKGQDVRLKLGYQLYDKVTKPFIIMHQLL